MNYQNKLNMHVHIEIHPIMACLLKPHFSLDNNIAYKVARGHQQTKKMHKPLDAKIDIPAMEDFLEKVGLCLFNKHVLN